MNKALETDFVISIKNYKFTHTDKLNSLNNIIKFYKKINTKSPSPQLEEALNFLELYRKNDVRKIRFDFQTIEMNPNKL